MNENENRKQLVGRFINLMRYADADTNFKDNKEREHVLRTEILLVAGEVLSSQEMAELAIQGFEKINISHLGC